MHTMDNTQTPATAAPDVAQPVEAEHPSQGGSYLRAADGSLQLQQRTQAPTPALAPAVQE